MKQQEKTELTKERILTAAISEFGEHGYLGSSINTICSDGISKGLVYHNFKNKDTLYLACVERSLANLLSYIRSQDALTDIASYMNARYQFFMQNENEAHIFFETLLQCPSNLTSEIKRLHTPFHQMNQTLYTSLIDHLQLRRNISRQDALMYFTMMQNMFNGYFSSSSCNMMSFSEKIKFHEENLNRMLQFMLYGIAEKKEDTTL